MTRVHPDELHRGDQFEIDGRTWTVREVTNHPRPTCGWVHIITEPVPGHSGIFTFAADDIIDAELSPF